MLYKVSRPLLDRLEGGPQSTVDGGWGKRSPSLSGGQRTFSMVRCIFQSPKSEGTMKYWLVDNAIPTSKAKLSYIPITECSFSPSFGPNNQGFFLIYNNFWGTGCHSDAGNLQVRNLVGVTMFSTNLQTNSSGSLSPPHDWRLGFGS